MKFGPNFCETSVTGIENSMYVFYDLRNKRPEIASEETFSPASGSPDSNENEKDNHRHPRSDRIEEEGAQIGQASLESQLNVIYNSPGQNRGLRFGPFFRERFVPFP